MSANNRPAGLLLGFVVFILPGGAAAVAAVAGDGDQAVRPLFLTIASLHQLRVSGRATPGALNAGAGVAKRHFFEFIEAVGVLGHGVGRLSKDWGAIVAFSNR